MSSDSEIGDTGRKLATLEIRGTRGVDEGLHCVDALAEDEDTKRGLLDTAVIKLEAGSEIENVFLERDRLRTLETEENSSVDMFSDRVAIRASTIAGGVFLLLAQELVRPVAPSDKELFAGENPCFDRIDAVSRGQAFLTLILSLVSR